MLVSPNLGIFRQKGTIENTSSCDQKLVSRIAMKWFR